MAWKGLRHQNLLPLLGVTMTENRLVIASEWMVKGNVRDFLEKDASADRLELVRSRSRSLSLTMT